MYRVRFKMYLEGNPPTPGISKFIYTCKYQTDLNGKINHKTCLKEKGRFENQISSESLNVF